jgi:hypothetical protein
VSGQLHAPSRFTPGEIATGTHWIGGWVGSRTGLNDVEKRKLLTLPGLELRPFGRSARSQSLYRLGYPGPSKFGNISGCSLPGPLQETDEVTFYAYYVTYSVRQTDTHL